MTLEFTSVQSQESVLAPRRAVAKRKRASRPQGPRIAIVVGMKAEGRIADVGDDLTIVSGGSAVQVEAGLKRAMNRSHAQGRPLQGIFSFGVAGGLAAHLRPGDIVLPHRIHIESDAFDCHGEWVSNLARRLPHAHKGALVGWDAPVETPAHKRHLHLTHDALAVDMESHCAARFARAQSLPFAALRAIADPQHRALPPAALVGIKSDGATNVKAVIAALARSPSQLPDLIQTAFDARAGLTALLGSRRLLGAFFGFEDFA
jgi:adenosylhomocysteine nucleosidase